MNGNRITESAYLDDLRERVLEKLREEARNKGDDFDSKAVVFKSNTSRTNNALTSIDVTGKVRSVLGNTMKHNVCLTFSYVDLNKSHNVRREKKSIID